MADDPAGQTGRIIEALRGVLCQLAEPSVVLRVILEQAVTQTRADRGLFVEVAEEGDLAYRILHGFQPRHFEGDAGRFSRQLFQRVIESGKEVVLENALDDPYYREIESVREMRATSILCVPIRVGARIGALIHLETRRPGHFKRQHVEALRPLLEVAGPVLGALKAGRDVLVERDRLKVSETRYRSEAEESRRLLASEWSFGRFIGRSEAVRALEETVHKAAGTEFPVLISGETGTGKSILARVLHYAGPRADRPLITVFCPSLEKGMVEAELFGHKRGAFTGAMSDRLGKVQAADGGTLFLDEIGELPLEIQPKLLRLLQEKSYERVGDTVERKADVRIVAATNRDLEQEIQEGRFRRDLYERLNFIPIRIPPLRERLDDIPLLLRHCLDSTESGRWIELAGGACEFLERLPFTWPGNVRHIEQLAARLTMEGARAPVEAADLSRLLGARERENPTVPGAGAQAAAGLEQGLPRLLEEAERAWLAEALQRYPNLTRADIATKLKISESALYKKLRQYDLGG
jgi:transcriptional regulator with GAF, ATPase, and Fis domain